MLLLEFFFLLCLAVVDSQRYYAFVETLFVIDTAFFPQPSLISYDDYVRTIVDTSNIVRPGDVIVFDYWPISSRYFNRKMIWTSK